MKYSRLLTFIVIGLLASVLTFFIYRQNFHFLDAVDPKLKDARFKLRENIQPDSRVVIVAIDSKSVNEIGRWPWKRSVFAGLLNGLKEYGVRVTALDIVFSEPSDSREDAVLSRAIEKNGSVILGYFFRDEKEEANPRAISQIESSKIKLL
ncbi:MAG: CHASE2 domain-containing protein, partial [Nitrospirota bacterium]|nr:CHASE2 domain-containing protein [Nitrospirota bacterium]